MLAIIQRRPLRPCVLQIYVVCDLVQYDLDAVSPAFADHVLQIGERAEMILDPVIIDRVIAVIVRVWAPGLVAAVHTVPVVVPGR